VAWAAPPITISRQQAADLFAKPRTICQLETAGGPVRLEVTQGTTGLDSGELAALCGIAFERYPGNAVAGIRPLFDYIEFASIAPCAAWPVVTERPRGKRVARFYGTSIDVPDPRQFDKGATKSVDGQLRRHIPGVLLRRIGMLAPGNPSLG
jgi:hypothetical protein